MSLSSGFPYVPIIRSVFMYVCVRVFVCMYRPIRLFRNCVST